MISSIYDDIDRSDMFVAVITKNFSFPEDAYARIRERTHYAVETGKPIYALVGEGCEVPDYLKPHIILSVIYHDRQSALDAGGRLARYHAWSITHTPRLF